MTGPKKGAVGAYGRSYCLRICFDFRPVPFELEVRVRKIEYRFSVADHQYLWRFVFNVKQLRYAVKDTPVCQQVEKIALYLSCHRSIPMPLQAIECRPADVAARAVLVN